MFLQTGIGPHAFQNFFGFIAEDVMDRRINLILAIYFAQVAEKTGGQIAIAHSPFLHDPLVIFGALLALSLGIKIIGERVRQTIVETYISLEMVVDFGTLDAIENGIYMGGPIV